MGHRCRVLAMALALCSLGLPPGQAQDAPRNGPSAMRPTLGQPPGRLPPTRQLRACDFTMEASAIRLLRSTLAPGRVKVPPRATAARRLEFTVLDRKGRQVYAGSLDHPCWQESESEDPAAPGQLRRSVHKVPRGLFQIRLPAEIGGTRVAFFEFLPGKPGARPGRRALGVVPLP